MPRSSFPGTALPIIQAPMAGVQGSALTIAVCNAGAVGSLPCAMLSSDALRAELQSIASQTRNPYNVNFFCHTPPQPDDAREMAWRSRLAPFFEELGLSLSSIANGPGRMPINMEMAEILAEFKPPIVSFHFGLPAPELIEFIKSWGARVVSSATTVDEARWLEDHGADAVIAQGLEAGGHRGHFLSTDLTLQMGTFALLPQVVKAVRIPVIAAGGISNADGVRAAMSLGASAVQVGTAFLLSNEATTSTLHRAALQSDRATHTALTNVFTGRPARGIVNRLMRELTDGESTGMSRHPPEFPGATNALTPLRAQAESRGKDDFTPLWSGQNNSECLAAPAADIVNMLARGL